MKGNIQNPSIILIKHAEIPYNSGKIEKYNSRGRIPGESINDFVDLATAYVKKKAIPISWNI